MNAKDVKRFVMRYLDATGCEVTEKSPAHVTVRLSPEADKDLTNRPYYWSFVERTGAPPETMTLTFVFEPGEAVHQATPASATGGAAPAGGGDSILNRYFGFAPAPAQTSRTLFDEMTFGSKRLEQLFGVVRRKGKFVQMFEHVKTPAAGTPLVYQSWLAVNYKVEFLCDMKRDELHSLGISLATGRIVDSFDELLASRSFTPRLVTNALVQRPAWTLARAGKAIEKFLQREIGSYNHEWAAQARERFTSELAVVDAYYEEVLDDLTDPDSLEAAARQYEARKKEIAWQYAPRIEANVVSSGIFHLADDTPKNR